MIALLEQTRTALRSIQSLAQEGVPPVRFGERLFEILTIARHARRQIDRALAGDEAPLAPSSLPPSSSSVTEVESQLAAHFARVVADAECGRLEALEQLAHARDAAKVLLEEVRGIDDVDVTRAATQLSSVLWPSTPAPEVTS